jgi:hypothetical protein
MKVLAMLVLLVTLPIHSALAQSGANTGLMGRVTDPSGAAVPGVAITVTNTDTGSARTLTSGVTGDWEARFLAPGTHRASFELTGFKTLRRDGLVVSTTEMATVNVTLEVGTVAEMVEVTGNARMTSSDSSTLVRTLDQRELEQLPTSARNFTQLLITEPGVSADLSDLVSNNNASISPSVNGARTTNNSFVFNGTDVTSLLCCNSRVNGSRGTIDQGGGSLSRNIAPALETLQEVKLQTSLYDAATGRNGGGNFQLVSKSGSNRFFGTGYWYMQNDRLAANDYFFDRADIEKPELNRNEEGFTLGGPIFRNKTFFFGSYQRTDAKTGYVDEASSTVRVPRALTDDRSNAGIDRFAATLWGSNRGPFNAAAINPISRALLQATFADGSYLVPSGANGINCGVEEDQLSESCQVTSVIPATFEQNQFSAGFDHQANTAHRLSLKLFFADQPSVDPLADGDALTRFEVEEKTDQRTLSLSDVHVFGDSMVNEIRGGVFRNHNDTVPVSYFSNQQFGIQNPFAATVPDLSQIEIGAEDVGSTLVFGGPGSGTRVFDTQTTFTFGDTLTFSRGTHSFRAGGEFRHSQLDGDLQELQNRRHNFDTWFNFLTVGYRDSANSNRARQIADTALNYGETARNYRLTDWNWFLADDWRIGSRLTVNAGVRHDYYGMPSETKGLFAVFDYQAALATGKIQDGLIFPSNFDPSAVPGAAGQPLNIADSKTIIPGDYNNIQPRIGFAWTPTDSGTTVVRGGYGIFYERTTAAFANSLRQSGPFFREAQLDDLGDWNVVPTDYPALPIPGMSVGFDEGEPQLEGTNAPGEEFEALETQVLPPNMTTPYMQQWNADVQWEFRPNWLLDVAYVGSRGSNLLQFVNANQPQDISQIGFLPRPGVPGGGFTGNYYTIRNDQFVNLTSPPAGCDLEDDPDECVVPAELRGTLLGLDEDEGANALSSDGYSRYHSLQTSLQKRFSNGYMFNASYTLSRSIDTFSDEGLYQVQHDSSHPELNEGLSDFNRTHRMIFSWSWELPFQGNAWKEGWQLSGIGTIQSGRPFTVVDSDHSAILFASDGPRPNAVSGVDPLTSGSMTDRVDGYLNPDAFESSGIAWGNLGRNTFVGPIQRRLDVSLAKQTRLYGNSSMELRLEAYNIMNTTSFRNPNSDLSDGDFGEITRMLGGPRVIQLAVKFRF